MLQDLKVQWTYLEFPKPIVYTTKIAKYRLFIKWFIEVG